ncbi:hypothetical protein V8C35DRAFT_311154 [Trichoderma chlorosporum]
MYVCMSVCMSVCLSVSQSACLVPCRASLPAGLVWFVMSSLSVFHNDRRAVPAIDQSQTNRAHRQSHQPALTSTTAPRMVRDWRPLRARRCNDLHLACLACGELSLQRSSDNYRSPPQLRSGETMLGF